MNENKSVEIKVIENPKSFEEIAELDPTVTIIIGGETKLYKDCGFYYSFESASNVEELKKEYEDKIEAIGVYEMYSMMQAMYHEECLRNDDAQQSNSILLELLRAFEVNDYKEIGRILQFNLDTLLSNAERLNSIQSQLSKDSTFEIKAVTFEQQLKELTDKYNKLAAEASELRKMSSATAELLLTKDSLKEAEDKCVELSKEVAELKSKLENTCSKGELDDVKEKLAQAEKQLKEELKNKTETQKTTLFSESQEEIIRTLKAELQSATKNKSNITDENLPVITDSVNLSAEHLIFIKEIKRAPYMNTLLRWVGLKIASEKRKNKSRGIAIVYDNITELSEVKYNKHNFYINEEPDGSKPFDIVITSNTELAFLRNHLHIENYTYVIIIDRLGFSKMAVNRSINTKTYYLIDSYNDISDYNLDASKCIAFFSSIEDSDKKKCVFYVEPDGDTSYFGDREKLKVFTSKEFVKIFS